MRSREEIRKTIGLREVPGLRLGALDVVRTGLSNGLAPSGTRGVLHGKGVVVDTDEWRDGMVTMLRQATLWWVAQEMGDLLDAAAPSMPDQPLRADDLPDDDGFVIFERPLPGLDIGDDDGLLVSGFSWSLSEMTLPDKTSIDVVIIDSYSVFQDMGPRPMPIGRALWPIGEGLEPDWDTDDDTRASNVEDRRRLAALRAFPRSHPRLAAVCPWRRTSRTIEAVEAGAAVWFAGDPAMRPKYSPAAT